MHVIGIGYCAQQKRLEEKISSRTVPQSGSSRWSPFTSKETYYLAPRYKIANMSSSLKSIVMTMMMMTMTTIKVIRQPSRCLVSRDPSRKCQFLRERFSRGKSMTSLSKIPREKQHQGSMCVSTWGTQDDLLEQTKERGPHF